MSPGIKVANERGRTDRVAGGLRAGGRGAARKDWLKRATPQEPMKTAVAVLTGGNQCR